MDEKKNTTYVVPLFFGVLVAGVIMVAGAPLSLVAALAAPPTALSAASAAAAAGPFTTASLVTLYIHTVQATAANSGGSVSVTEK